MDIVAVIYDSVRELKIIRLADGLHGKIQLMLALQNPINQQHSTLRDKLHYGLLLFKWFLSLYC